MTKAEEKKLLLRMLLSSRKFLVNDFTVEEFSEDNTKLRRTRILVTKLPFQRFPKFHVIPIGMIEQDDPTEAALTFSRLSLKLEEAEANKFDNKFSNSYAIKEQDLDRDFPFNNPEYHDLKILYEAFMGQAFLANLNVGIDQSQWLAPDGEEDDEPERSS